MTTKQTLLKDLSFINSRIKPKEMIFLYELAENVSSNGTIVEVGSCYGGSSACLGLGAKDDANLILIDTFVHHPGGRASKQLLEANLKRAGLSKFVILETDCMSAEFDKWAQPIDLLHIDGAHDYEHIWHDLTTFGIYAKTIVCHDYDTIQVDIKPAVDKFVLEYPYFIEKIVETMVLLRRKV